MLATLQLYSEHVETPSLWWSHYYIQNTYIRTLSVLAMLLSYASHLHQWSVCANNATIIFRTRRNVQSMMVTLLHAEHVY